MGGGGQMCGGIRLIVKIYLRQVVFNTHHASVAHVALFLLLLLVMYNPWTVGPRGWVGEEGGSGVEVVKGKWGGGGGGPFV